MPKSRTSSRRKKLTCQLSVKLPPNRVREKFLIIYELEGCQKATDFLTEYYNVRRMRIILNGRVVGKKKSNSWIACYDGNKAYFTKEGLNKRVILHELYHHLVDCGGLELLLSNEEKEANAFARHFLRNQKALKSI
jgi:hypothetical protein